MAESNVFMSVIRIWAGLAWADGVIVDAEAEAMRRLIAGADGLNDEEKTEALGLLESKVELEIEAVKDLSEQVRQGIYRAAYRLAKVDLEIADEERKFLARLGEGLGLQTTVCKELETAIDGGTE